MSPPRDRDAVLARRRLFVASALASLSVLETRCDSPRPCLDVAPNVDATPEPCLSQVVPPLDAAGDASATDVDAADATPVPCLSRAVPDALDAGADGGRVNLPPPKPPKVCLSLPPPMPCLTPKLEKPK